MCCGSLTFRTSAVRILCDTHVSYALPFLPALVGSHLNLFRTYTICFVPLIQVLPGFYIRLVLWTINIFGNLSPGARIMQFVHSLRYTLISSAIALFYKTLFTPFFVSQLLRFTPVVSHTNLIGAVRNSSLMFLIVLHYETLIKHNRNLSAAKSTYHPCSAETSGKSGALIYPEPLGPPRPVAGDLYFFICCQIVYRIFCHSDIIVFQILVRDVLSFVIVQKGIIFAYFWHFSHVLIGLYFQNRTFLSKPKCSTRCCGTSAHHIAFLHPQLDVSKGCKKIERVEIWSKLI